MQIFSKGDNACNIKTYFLEKEEKEKYSKVSSAEC